MSTKTVQAIMSGLVVIAVLVVGCILLINDIDHITGIIMVVIVGGYLGIDLTPWIPLGKNQRRK